MTFLWKKVRLTKLPELVNDQLRKSQKRRDGSPLLIQTGFPASLIDLFFKNQDKLKKSPQKNRESSLSPIHVNHPSSPKPRNIHSPIYSPEKEMCVDANEVLFSVLKMFFVVVLALGMNRLTLGIAFSAFLLFSLDFLGKRVLSIFSKPCSIKIMEPTKCYWASQVEEILPKIEGVEKQVELKKKKSRKDKLKSKMTKFVSKKLKSCKKLEEINTCSNKDEENESFCGLSILDNNKEAVMMNREEEGTSIGGLNWSHLVLLISIVQIGLIGGRGFAIVLTLWCCLMVNWMK